MLPLLSLLTSRDLCHITYGVNTADGVGVGGVYVAVEDEGCVKDGEREITLRLFNTNLWTEGRLSGWLAYCAGWWACGWRCGWCKSGPGSTGCCGRSRRLAGRRHLCTQSLPEPWWGPPRCGGSWWSLEPPQTWGEKKEWRRISQFRLEAQCYPEQLCPCFCATLTIRGLSGHRGACPGTPGSPSGSGCT